MANSPQKTVVSVLREIVGNDADLKFSNDGINTVIRTQDEYPLTVTFRNGVIYDVRDAEAGVMEHLRHRMNDLLLGSAVDFIEREEVIIDDEATEIFVTRKSLGGIFPSRTEGGNDQALSTEHIQPVAEFRHDYEHQQTPAHHEEKSEAIFSKA